mgnify:CR=1 FL=1
MELILVKRKHNYLIYNNFRDFLGVFYETVVRRRSLDLFRVDQCLFLPFENPKQLVGVGPGSPKAETCTKIY